MRARDMEPVALPGSESDASSPSPAPPRRTSGNLSSMVVKPSLSGGGGSDLDIGYAADDRRRDSPLHLRRRDSPQDLRRHCSPASVRHRGGSPALHRRGSPGGLRHRYNPSVLRRRGSQLDFHRRRSPQFHSRPDRYHDDPVSCDYSSSFKNSNSNGAHFGSMAEAAKWRGTAMLVIDMQNDFILPGGPMNVTGGKTIVPAVIRAVSVARDRRIPVIWVVREHDPFGRDVEIFRRHLYANGNGPTAKGSEGAELVEGLVPEDGEYKLVKTRFSAFFDTHLNSLLQSSRIKSLVVVGVQTPNCIRQTVFDAVASNYQPVTVIVDATAAATPEVHIANIQDMKNIGVETPTLEEWCSAEA